MQKSRATDRRGFLQTSVGLGVAGAAGFGAAQATFAEPVERARRLPREVWGASLSLHGLEAQTYEEMIRKVFRRLEEIEPFEPDIVCLPEVFPFLKVSGGPLLAETAEVPPGPISERFAAWAKANHCYMICPIYTQQDGQIYNAAVVIDRNGKCLGEYRKIHPTVSEMEKGWHQDHSIHPSSRPTSGQSACRSVTTSTGTKGGTSWGRPALTSFSGPRPSAAGRCSMPWRG